MAEDLESRLKSHARAFEGLMSLIPAKDYYGKDESITSTQWNRKKQTKEERRAAKKAKLDPASHQTAKDVMDENARKRKRELEGEAEASSSDIDMDIEKEKPLEGLKTPVVKPKKQKTEKDAGEAASADTQAAQTPNEKHKAIADKRRQKRELKKEKKAQKQQKEQSKKALQDQFSTTLGDKKDEEEKDDDDEDEEDEEDADTTAFDGDDGLQALDVDGLEDEPVPTETPSSVQSNASTTSEPSATSSTSSIVPPSTDGAAKEKESKFKYDPAKQEDYRARLAAKLEQLRSKRKADGPDGRPAKNRAELIEARRKKEAERKAAKKASRQLAKEDEERLKAEEQLARIRGASGSPSIFSVPSTPEVETNLNFGKVAWNDGQQLGGDLSGFLEQRKKKGKSDPKSALEAAKKKQARLSGLDEDKRKDIEEKDAWLAAKKRAQGEKVFDDTKLLTKSVKRLEKEKAKSKQEWKERLTGVQKGIAMKQKKREENLKKRRDEKGTKKGGKKGKNAKGKKPGKKVTKRPGFEGTFKAR